MRRKKKEGEKVGGENIKKKKKKKSFLGLFEYFLKRWHGMPRGACVASPMCHISDFR